MAEAPRNLRLIINISIDMVTVSVEDFVRSLQVVTL